MSLHLLLTRFRFDPGPADRHAGRLSRVRVWRIAPSHTRRRARTQTNDTAHTNVRVGVHCKLHPEMQRLAVVVGRLDNTVA